MKVSHSPLHICNFHIVCTDCSPCDTPKTKIVFGAVYTLLTVLLAVAVYAATTITLHKAEIVPQNPSDLSCLSICPPEYALEVDADRCCTSGSALSCKTKLQCKDWMLEHGRNYVIVAYAYITLFACIVLVHIFICLRRKCERDSQGEQPTEKKKKVLRWRNKHAMNSLEDSLFDNEPKCEVCLKEVRPNKVVTLTCCKSLAHAKCLKGWMEEIDNCPSCGKLMESLPSK
jgi:hypothetical protein